jgi:hypothetical protein
MKSRFKNILRSIIFGLIGVTSLFGAHKAQAVTSYPIVNGQIVRFELSNGVALNIQNASLANDKPIYSFTGNNNDPEQHFKVISNGDGYNFQRNGSSYSLSASTLTPANLSPAVAYQSGFGQWQDFWLDDAPGGGYYLIKWRKDPNWCLNVPGSQSNVKITFFQCNAADNDQRFRIVNIANQQYVSPMANGAVGVLEAASGYRIIINSNIAMPIISPRSDTDPDQRFQFIRVAGNQYLLQKSGTNTSISSNTLDYVTANSGGMATTKYTTGEGRWQNFGFVNSSILGWYNIKYAWNPNFCLSAGTPGGNISAQILPCDANSTLQRFKFDASYVVEEQKSDYEVWVVGRKRADYLKVITGIPSGSPDVGHAFIAVVNDKYKLQKRYSTINNALIDQTIIDRVPTIQATYSYWPSGSPANNNSSDLGNANDILTTGGIQNKIYGVRRVRVSASFANSVSSKSSSTKCNSSTTQYGAHWAYLPNGSGSYAWTELPYCTCVDQSIFLWKNVTGEDMGYKTTPDQVTQWIIDKNATDTGYANGGIMIP